MPERQGDNMFFDILLMCLYRSDIYCTLESVQEKEIVINMCDMRPDKASNNILRYKIEDDRYTILINYQTIQCSFT